MDPLLEHLTKTNQTEKTTSVSTNSDQYEQKYSSLVDLLRNAHVHLPRQSCPRCADSMAIRFSAKNGWPFWGCNSFPKCKGFLPVLFYPENNNPFGFSNC